MVVPRLSHGLCFRKGEASRRLTSVPTSRQGMLRPYTVSWLIQVLEDPGRSHPPSDAHGDHAPLQLAPLHFIEDLRRQLGPGAAQRMPERDRPAVDVDDVRIDVQLADDGHGL